MDKWLAWFQIGSVVLSALIVWLASSGRLGYATGRFVQRRERDAEDIAELQRAVKTKAEFRIVVPKVQELSDVMIRISERMAKTEVRTDHLEKRADVIEERLSRWKWREADERRS